MGILQKISGFPAFPQIRLVFLDRAYLAIPPCIAEIAFMAIEVQSASALCLLGLFCNSPRIQSGKL